jgi:hypothetical protein
MIEDRDDEDFGITEEAEAETPDAREDERLHRAADARAAVARAQATGRRNHSED